MMLPMLSVCLGMQLEALTWTIMVWLGEASVSGWLVELTIGEATSATWKHLLGLHVAFSITGMIGYYIDQLGINPIPFGISMAMEGRVELGGR